MPNGKCMRVYIPPFSYRCFTILKWAIKGSTLNVALYEIIRMKKRSYI